MAIEALINGLSLATQAINLIKQIKDLLPSSPQKEIATQTLENAENSFKVAEAQIAVELGYHLCQCKWPPEIMLKIPKTNQFICKDCGSIIDTSPSGIAIEPISRKRFFDKKG